MRDSKRFPHHLVALLLLLFAVTGCRSFVDEPVRYERLVRPGIDAHVVVVDLQRPGIRVVVSDPDARGMTVSEAAIEEGAVAAINGDYFDEEKRPVGISIGECRRWESAGSPRRQWVIGFGEGRAEIFHPEGIDAELPGWVTDAVSGWPLLIENCEALSSDELPGSDGFTRSPHPRTAAGIGPDGRYLYLVVADGRREGVPGLELARLARIMAELGVCEAINLDGGGSSALFFERAVLNVPSDGEEREVSNHLLVLSGVDGPRCN